MSQKPKLPPLNLDPSLHKARNRIHRLGIELEGGWEKLPKGLRLTHDGSVQIPPPKSLGGLSEMERREYQNLANASMRRAMTSVESQRFNDLHRLHSQGVKFQTGEVPSPVLEMEDWQDWMRKFYPSHVNETCGLHVHFSFKSSFHYQRLMNPALNPTTVEYISRWAKEEGIDSKHCLWARLDGKSEYCQDRFFADAQASRTTKDHTRNVEGCRYTMWNFCYNLHGTAECRLLPMFDTVEQSIRAVTRLIQIVNAFLVVEAKREKAIESSVPFRDDDYVREEIIEIV